MITRRQKQLLDFISSFLESNGYCPSYNEMLDGIKASSKSEIHRLVLALDERGFIRRLPYRSRAIEILRASVTA